jgi:1-acyl-sn-glycerol-3-phosphate acyltransferase
VQATPTEILQRIAAPCGLLVGLTVARLQRHPTRRGVWVPAGFGILVAAFAVRASGGPEWLTAALGGTCLAFAVCGAVGRAIGAVALAVGIGVVVLTTGPSEADSARTMALMTAVAFVVSFWCYRRPVGETLGEWPIRVLYRLRAVGPGMDQLPRTGPVIVISNHPSFLDPCWLMIRLPRDLTPLMYAEYFQIPGLHFYMKHVVGAIPAGATGFRREVPELDEVVRRLDLGQGVLVFPEGWVRRKEEEELRRFAQGTWRVLRDRPTTPVVACWVEGGWGSWVSFKNGPPFKKRPDFRRPIDMGVSAPVVLDSETLADQHRTREALRQMVLDARRHLELPPIE